MSRNDEIFDLSKRVRRLEHERRHRLHASVPEGNFQKDDFAWNGCIWLFVFLFLVGIMLTFILVPYYRYPLPPPPPAKGLPPPQFVKQMPPKRGRGACAQSGEYYDAQLQMCAPQIHLPMAYDATIMDTRAQACHSFYNNSCGKWIEQHTAEHRTFTFAHHKNQALLKQIIIRNNTPLNDFYQSCLVKNAHEAGIELKHVLNVVTENLRTHADLPSVLGRLARFAYTGPFVLSIERNPLESRLLPMIAFDNLHVEEQIIYVMLNQARSILNYNVLDLQRRVQAIVKVIRTLNEHCPEQNRMESITNYEQYVNTTFKKNVFKFGSLKEWKLKGVHGPVDGWYQFFHAMDGHGLKFNSDQDMWLVGGDAYLKWLLSEGFNAFELFEWRAYLEFSILYHGHQFEPELPNNVYRRRLRLPAREAGTLGSRMKKRVASSAPPTPTGSAGAVACLSTTQHMLPGLVARAFLDLFDPIEYQAMRARITALTLHLRETFVQAIGTTAWLSEADRLILTNKLNKILIRVAEPDEWHVEPFAGQVAADRYDHNMNLIRRYRVERNLQLWNSNNDTLHRSAYATFAMPLDNVNAYYSPSTNTITILAGILQLPFFSNQFNKVSEYAILGSIIGHELSHALDANGLYWNDEGSYKADGIISQQAMREFKGRASCLVQEYQQEQRACVNYGEQTLSENIADVTGIHMAYKALAPTSMSDQQYFFFVLSQAFCEASAPTAQACNDDPHADPKYRIDLTFRNMPEFSRTFNCIEGQRMFKRFSCEIYGVDAR